MSSLLRSEAVAVLDRLTAGSAVSTAPRIFGTRVLRGDTVGMERPIPLSVPAAQSALSVSAEAEPAAPPPPDFAAIEEAARLQGYNEGYEQGRSAGLAAAEAVMADSLQQIARLLGGITENHAGFFRAAERQVVDLALQIASKVVEREVENMPDLAISVIRSALEEMDARTAVRIRVNPDDVELLRRRWSQIIPSGVAADRIELLADERIQPGGGVIETTHGQVDAQLDTKLQQLGNALWTFVMDVDSSSASPVAGDGSDD